MRTYARTVRLLYRPLNESPFPKARAFTFLELLTSLAVLLLLILTLLPALAHNRPQSAAAVCMNNLKSLALAWQAYSSDNQDRLLISIHGGGAMYGVGNPAYGPFWAGGWLDWLPSTDVTNTTMLLDIRRSRLAPYAPSPHTFHCPSDRSPSQGQLAAGFQQRARSYSLNIYIGQGNALEGPSDTLYRNIRTMSDFRFPSPRETWVFLEEHPDSINDGAFFSPHSTGWVDLPAPFHSTATPFAFADAHVEMHRWTSSLSKDRAVRILFNTYVPVPIASGDSDISWMSYHTQRVSTNSF